MGSMMHIHKLAAAALLFLGAARAEAGYFDGRHFPIVTDDIFTADEFILEQAHFWYSIYVEVGDDEGLLHDPFYPHMVFRKVSAPGQGRATSKVVEAHVEGLRNEIRAMLAKDTAAWTPQDRALRANFPSYWDSTGIMLSTERIRFQRGLKGKFRAGLERSYRYLPLIDSIFATQGVPARLRFLPHVESSFYPYAYSKVGAAGMWQFMKSSAKLFKMKVGYDVDERRDPHASTLGAAKMLAYNYRWLKSWPLAIVAYNHGPGGLSRAAKQTGTRDLGTIIKSYYSNSFGFASKNFYAEFLAASSIALKADSLFPDLRKMEPLQYQYLILAKPIATRSLCTVTGLTPAELEEYNLGLRPATFRGKGALPKGFALRLPMTTDMAAVAARLGGQMVAAVSPRPVTDTIPQVAMAASSPQDKVENRAAEAAPGEAPENAKRRLPAKEKPAAPEPRPQASLTGVGAADVASWKTPREEARDKVRDRILEKTSDKDAGKPSAKPSPALAKAPPIPVGPAGLAATATPSVPQSAAVESLAQGHAALKAAEAVDIAAAAKAVKASEAAASAKAAGGAVPGTSAPAPGPEDHIVDSALALQASDLDKLAHPMDRFNPAVYNLQYEYADGKLSFLVGPEETLSHYAEWAWVPEKTLRALNKIRNPRDFRMGRRIRIPLTEEKAAEFQKRREESYRAIEEDFYGNYYVSMTEPLVVQKGLNLWSWSQERELPFWLLQKHNPGVALNELHPGDTLHVPLIENGIRKWGFTRYANSREYLSGISRFLATGKAEAY
jgi:membrane-bound lytic murein transglycosylase D